VVGLCLEVPVVSGCLAAGYAAALVVRPETIRLAPSIGPSSFIGTIRRATYLGATVEYELEWEGATILAVISSPLEQGVLPEGATVAFEFPPATAHALPAGRG